MLIKCPRVVKIPNKTTTTIKAHFFQFLEPRMKAFVVLSLALFSTISATSKDLGKWNAKYLRAPNRPMFFNIWHDSKYSLQHQYNVITIPLLIETNLR